jgi:hypothetical protein
MLTSLRLPVNSGPKPAAQAPKKPKGELSNGVNNLSIQEPAKLKSKNIDVIAEYGKVKRKNAANFVVIGMYQFRREANSS